MILTVAGVLLGSGSWPQARGVKGARERAIPAVIWVVGGVFSCCMSIRSNLEGRAG